MEKKNLVVMGIDELNKELKRVGSLKCNLKKRKGVINYDEELKNILRYEDEIKEVKYSLMNKGKSYYEFNFDDIDKLNIDELVRFRKGVSSKKCLDGNDVEILERCEELLEYSKKVLDEKRNKEEKDLISKNELRKLIENYEVVGNVDLLVESIKNLIE